ncbi:MAG: tRNA pseudouridine(55) synthase TruB [Dehalococcoidia bacterium]
MVRGFINVDKPQGITSFDVVRRIRRAAGIRKVGHAGTLDPNATGVLPVAVGDATRLVDELVDASKRYEATIVFGEATDTYDIEGAVTEAHDASHVTQEAVLDALAPFVGDLMQRPPAYSAVKREGVTAYKAARAGNPLELEPRPVVVHAIDVLSFDRARSDRPVLRLDVRCGKGFYVRSLAHDLGQALGVGAHLSALRRTQVGPFVIADATPLDAAVRLLEAREFARVVHAPDVVLGRWPALLVSPGEAARLRQGMDITLLPRRGYRPPEGASEGARARCYGPDGQLVALVERGGAVGAWHPFRVFPADPDATVE